MSMNHFVDKSLWCNNINIPKVNGSINYYIQLANDLITLLVCPYRFMPYLMTLMGPHNP